MYSCDCSHTLRSPLKQESWVRSHWLTAGAKCGHSVDVVWSTQLLIRFEFKCYKSHSFSLYFATDPTTPYCFIPPDSHIHVTYLTPGDIWVTEPFIIVSQVTFYFWHSVIQNDLGKRALSIPSQLVDIQTQPAVPCVRVGILTVADGKLWSSEVIAALPLFPFVNDELMDQEVRYGPEKASIHKSFRRLVYQAGISPLPNIQTYL